MVSICCFIDSVFSRNQTSVVSSDAVKIQHATEESCKRASDRHSPKIYFCQKKIKFDEKNKEIFIYQNSTFVNKKFAIKLKFEKKLKRFLSTLISEDLKKLVVVFINYHQNTSV